MTEQPSDRCYSQISFDPSSKGVKSGNKGERFASSGSFCPLRFCVNVKFNLYRPLFH